MVIIAGSVCKDFSSMGKGAGFLGQYVILCAIFISLCYVTKPALVIHECTPRFPFQIFEQTLGTYTEYHTLLNAADFGVPVQRNRGWDAILSNKWTLPRGLCELHELSSKCVLDASLWLLADDDEASFFFQLPTWHFFVSTSFYLNLEIPWL